MPPLYTAPMLTEVLTASLSTPIGVLTLQATQKGICELQFVDHDDTMHIQESPVEILQEASKQLAEYFDGKRTTFHALTLHYPATDFQREVWDALMEVPYGEVITYGELAKRSGHEGAARAVGTAMNVNPLPIIIPCHRVLPSDKSVGEYAFGADRKKWLLEHEH